MLKSWTNDDEKSEWRAVEEADHVAAVWTAVEHSMPEYLAKMVAPSAPGGEDILSKLKATGNFKVTSKKAKPVAPIADPSHFDDALKAFEKRSAKYQEFFVTDLLQEFRDDDPDSFKGALSKRCPVIQGGLNAKSEDLKEWKIKFKMTPSSELLTTFENLVTFADEYLESDGDEDEYSQHDAMGDFEFEGFDGEHVGVPGVIGGGIKSEVLYNLHPRLFPLRSKRALCGLYFLTGRSHFGLRSKTSEFLMIDDTIKNPAWNMRMDHNYWYSYALFTLYAMRVARALQDAFIEKGLSFEVDHRYVYVDAFFRHVCDCHPEDMKVMGGGDDMSWGWK
jgi:hypothetical protein